MRQLRTVVCLASLLLLSTPASAQLPTPAARALQQDIINTFAGGGPNNIPATSANVPLPWGVATDTSGNFYFSSWSSLDVRVYKVDKSGTLTVLAGNGLQGYSGDGGPAAQAELNGPRGVAADSFGNVYIADTGNCIIRKIDTTGTISTFAGTPPVNNYTECGYSGDGGLATSAYLNSPYGIAVDSSGNVYIADTNNYRIREVTVSNGEINTVAGGYACGSGGAACGDRGLATSAGIGQVYYLAVDGSGNVYIFDLNNNVVREFSVGGDINTVAGNGSTCTGSYYPVCGDGGPATSAEISSAYGIAVDSPGNIFIADYDDMRIREVTVSSGYILTSTGSTPTQPGYIYTVAGNGQGCGSWLPAACGNGGSALAAGIGTMYGLAVDSSDDMFIADWGQESIREVTASNGSINEVAGNGTQYFAGNGVPPTSAFLYYPSAATSDSAGNIYIADQWNCMIREVSATTGNITSFAGTPNVGACIGLTNNGDGGPAASANLVKPSKAVAHAGDVYIADTDLCVIREVDSAGIISLFAGTEPNCSYSGDGGAATSAMLNYPTSVAVDGSGNVYIADRNNERIREVTVSNGDINTVAGGGTGCAGQTDSVGDGCQATSAMLNHPNDVALDASGNLYIADESNSLIRMVNTSGIISTFAGGGTGCASQTDSVGDGCPATEAILSSPTGVAVDAAGDVVIADMASNRIRYVDGQGIIHTVAGDGSYGFSGDGGLGTSAMLAQPLGLGFDPSGNIYVADTNNLRVRMISALAALNASTTSITFSPQQIRTPSSPQTVTLSAAGPLDISNIVITGDFSSPGDCVTGPMSGQCEMSLVFTPTGIGTRQGTVTISDNGYFNSSLVINLLGTGTGASVSLLPATLSFGHQDGGTTSAAKTLTLSNNLSSSLSISASLGGANPGDFTVQASSTCPYPTGSLAGNSSCTYNITFTPSVNGAESATLSVTDADGTQAAKLSGTGIGATLSPTTVTFAAQDGGATSAPRTLTLTNYLSSSLAISASLGGTYPGDFTVLGTGTCPYPSGSLAANSSCTYNITFTPSVNGAESATLSVSDADGTQTTTLKGTGIGATLAPTTLSFAAQHGGTTSAAKTLTLTNYLSTSLSISATLGGTDPGDFTVQGTSTCPYPSGSLGVNSSCTYSITFTPSMNGAESATLSVTDADGTQTATLKGTGVGATLAPAVLVFAAQKVGTTSVAKTLTLTNYLGSALSISATLGGTNPGDFTVQGTSTCPYPSGSLGANSSCTYSITFTPSLVGAESATLSVTDADGTQMATLKGTGK